MRQAREGRTTGDPSGSHIRRNHNPPFVQLLIVFQFGDARLKIRPPAPGGFSIQAQMNCTAVRPMTVMNIQPVPELQAKLRGKVTSVLLQVASNSSELANMPTKMIQ